LDGLDRVGFTSIDLDSNNQAYISYCDGINGNLKLATENAEPSAPHSLIGYYASNQVTLSWTAPATDHGFQVDGYNIYRGTAAGEMTLVASFGTEYSYNDRTPVTGTGYYFVKAFNAFGESAGSNEVGISAAGSSLRATGSDLTVVRQGENVLVSWDPNATGSSSSLEACYSIYRNSSSGWIQVGMVNGTCSFTDVHVPAGNLQYRVFSVDQNEIEDSDRTTDGQGMAATAGPGFNLPLPVIAIVVIGMTLLIFLMVRRREGEKTP